MLFFEVCENIRTGIIAVLTIGNSPTFELAKTISNSLDIPYIAIKSDAYLNTNEITNENKIFGLNLYPSLNKVNQIIIDLINNYKWTYVTVLFQDTKRLENLIRFATFNDYFDRKITFEFKTLHSNTSFWGLTLKEVKASGSSHIIVDLEFNLINKFFKIVNLFKLKIFRIFNFLFLVKRLLNMALQMDIITYCLLRLIYHLILKCLITSC